MRSTVIISRRGDDYFSTVTGRFGGGHQGERCGINPQEAATHAEVLMLRYGATNPDGASLMAPEEVLALIPSQVRRLWPAKAGEEAT